MKDWEINEAQLDEMYTVFNASSESFVLGKIMNFFLNSNVFAEWKAWEIKNSIYYAVKHDKFFLHFILFEFCRFFVLQKQNDKYVLQGHSRIELKIKFEEMLFKDKPIVLILASCWSHKSEISNILRSIGIFTVMNMLEEHGEITNGNMFLLDPEQQEFLKKIANLAFKVIILMGMNIILDLTVTLMTK